MSSVSDLHTRLHPLSPWLHVHTHTHTTIGLNSVDLTAQPIVRHYSNPQIMTVPQTVGVICRLIIVTGITGILILLESIVCSVRDLIEWIVVSSCQL